MKVKVLKEAGYTEAKLGLSLSYNTKVPMDEVCYRLAFKGRGHNKYLESIQVWLDITMPRHWWQEFDTYRVGMTKQSESTMHTILRKPFSSTLFACKDMSIALINLLNSFREKKEWRLLKDHLPESFLQRRIVCTNYKVLQNMEDQRRNHKLEEWPYFLDEIQYQVENPEFIQRVGNG